MHLEMKKKNTATKNMFFSHSFCALFLALGAAVVVVSAVSSSASKVSIKTTDEDHKNAVKGTVDKDNVPVRSSFDSSSETEISNDMNGKVNDNAKEKQKRSPPPAECVIEVEKVVRVPGKCIRLRGSVGGCESFQGGYMEPFSAECSGSESN